MKEALRAKNQRLAKNYSEEVDRIRSSIKRATNRRKILEGKKQKLEIFMKDVSTIEDAAIDEDLLKRMAKLNQDIDETLNNHQEA